MGCTLRAVMHISGLSTTGCHLGSLLPSEDGLSNTRYTVIIISSRQSMTARYIVQQAPRRILRSPSCPSAGSSSSCASPRAPPICPAYPHSGRKSRAHHWIVQERPGRVLGGSPIIVELEQQPESVPRLPYLALFTPHECPHPRPRRRGKRQPHGQTLLFEPVM